MLVYRIKPYGNDSKRLKPRPHLAQYVFRLFTMYIFSTIANNLVKPIVMMKMQCKSVYPNKLLNIKAKNLYSFEVDLTLRALTLTMPNIHRLWSFDNTSPTHRLYSDTERDRYVEVIFIIRQNT